MAGRCVARQLVCGSAVMLAAASPASADVFRDIGFGLGVAGFDIAGRNNFLSGGVDLQLTRNFGRGILDDTLDFGVADLRLRGPVSLGVSTGRRGAGTLDINFQTALTPDLPSQPLTYEFNADVGGQRTLVSGSLFVDGSLSLNGFGYYDLQLDYSSRQDVERAGGINDSESEFDFDAGPIRIRGNLLADALALITEPVFDAAGVNNPFAAFSGRAKLLSALDASMDNGRGDGLAFNVLEDAFTAGFRGSSEAQLRGVSDGFDAPGPYGRSAVPEPAMLLLLLAGLPVLARRKT